MEKKCDEWCITDNEKDFYATRDVTDKQHDVEHSGNTGYYTSRHGSKGGY